MRIDLDRLKTLASAFNEYFDALMACFVGREHIIQLLKYAMAQRQHILIFGPPGTAKTALCDVALSGITGAEKFMIELSAYLTEDSFFGPYDAKKMRERGVMEHRIEGMLPTANFARIGEFLDGNMASLRALLSSLNERRLRRGRQIVDMPLLTVYCDTNMDPGEFLKKYSNAWAVLDRILFMSYLGYLNTPEEVAEMVQRFQSGATANIGKTIDLSLIHQLSEIIVFPPTIISDQMIILKLGPAFLKYREQRRKLAAAKQVKLVLPEISDRRLCLASQMVEVGAVLAGRISALPEDIKLIKYAIGTTQEEFQLWDVIADETIQEIEEEKKKQLDAAQSVALDAIDKQIAQLDLDAHPTEAANTLKVLLTQLDGIAPENDGVAERKAKMEQKLSDLRRELRKRILQPYGLDGANHNHGN